MPTQQIAINLFQKLNSLFKENRHLKAEKIILQYFCINYVFWD